MKFAKRKLVVAGFLVAAFLVVAALCVGANRTMGATDVGMSCAPVEGFDAISEKSIIILGDYHGTNEPPRLVSDLACNFRKRTDRGTVLVALELPTYFNEYFEANDAASLARASRDPFWAEFKDGRHSLAMQRLVAVLQQESIRTGRIRLIAVQQPPIDSEGPKILSDAIRRLEPVKTVVLVGNAHARKKRFAPAGVDPFGMRLAGMGYSVVSLDIKPGGGTAWFCKQGACGTHVLPNYPDRNRVFLSLDGCAECPYDGSYVVPMLTIAEAANVKH